MTKIKQIIQHLESFAPLSLQESYDNSGLLVGDRNESCSGVLLTLDCVESVVDEAIESNCNLIIAHHPIIFSGLKSLTGKNYIERTVLKAIKNDIAIYACHTNLDHVKGGVNHHISNLLGLENQQILAPKNDILSKLEVFVPKSHTEQVLQSLADVGAGKIGNYSSCSFTSEGNGRFLPNESAKPFMGSQGKSETVIEDKIEVVFPNYKKGDVLNAMKQSHPYEEVSYYIHSSPNKYTDAGSGMIGILDKPIPYQEFFDLLKEKLGASVIKYTTPIKEKIQKVAVCGGAGSFLLKSAIAAKADIFVTSDFKYHEFFDADNKIVIADIGHYETESCTKDLFYEILNKKFVNIALVLSKSNTNPVKYY